LGRAQLVQLSRTVEPVLADPDAEVGVVGQQERALDVVGIDVREDQQVEGPLG
jgi:hypothetical protein